MKRAILTNLAKANGDTLTSAQLASRVNEDPELPENYRKTPKQLNFVMKKIGEEFDSINQVVMSRNGTSHHGNARFRMGFNTQMSLAEAESAVGVVKKPKSNLKQVTVNLPDECVEYIKAWRAKGVAAGRAVEALIRADIEANGLPQKEDD